MAKKVEKVKTPTSRAGKCNGLSFLELILTLFIISLLAAIVLPSFYGSGGRKTDSDAKRIASILRHLNDLSISTKEQAFIRFDLNSSSISWKSPEGEKTEVFKSLSAVKLPSKGTIREGQVIMFFSPLGIEEDVTVYLGSESDGTKVMLSNISGRVKISTQTEKNHEKK